MTKPGIKYLVYFFIFQGNKMIDDDNVYNTVLIECMKKESDLKLKQMAEAHEWAKEESQIRIENLKLKNILLQKQIQNLN